METVLPAWQFMLLILAGWINREQQRAIEYLRTENKVLWEKLGKKRILLNDDQRRRLAVKGKILGRKALREVATIVTPDTILRWHRKLVAKKWDYTDRRKKKPGRPPLTEELKTLVVKIARENPTWGYDRIAGAAKNVGHQICDESVRNILKAHGIEPAPDRKQQTTWKTFIKAHWDVLASIDFTTIEVWTKGGLVTYYLLFIMELKTRRVHFAGCTPNPNEAWMKQVARNITGVDDALLRGKRYLIMDRDGKFCPAFNDILGSVGVDALPLPPRSPNLNAHIERFFLSLKSECLSRMIFFGEKSLRTAATQFVAHYHTERNHQGNSVIATGYTICPDCGYEFPPPDRQKHEATASEAGILSGQKTDTEYNVLDISYQVHVKRGADDDAPKTMRVDYRLGLDHWQSEWVCFEHFGYARRKAESWWRKRSPDPVPATAQRAVDIAEACGLAWTKQITVREVAGEPYAQIIDYELGEAPDPVPADPRQLDLDSIPF